MLRKGTPVAGIDDRVVALAEDIVQVYVKSALATLEPIIASPPNDLDAESESSGAVKKTNQ
jgi:hypothetical protein